MRDWAAVNITLKRGFTGAKPSAFVSWVLDALNVQPGDVADDLFPGSGAVSDAITAYMKDGSDFQEGLFA